MKTLTIIFLIFISCIFMQAQEALRLRCTLASVSDFNDYTNDFNDFSELTATNIVITITETKITIYSRETQYFSIINTTEKLYTKKDNTPYIKVTCVDGDGKRCSIYIYMYPEGLTDMVLKYSNLMVSYTCKIE
jgi:hypothetical protein